MMGKSAAVGRVLFVIGSLRIGGAEKQLVLLADELARRGWQVSIYSLEDRSNQHSRVSSTSARVYYGGWDLTWPRWFKVLALVGAVWRLIRLSRLLDVDVLHGVLPLTNFLGAIAGWATGRPLVITARRALGTHQNKSPLWRLADRIANALSNCVVCNSHAVASDTFTRGRIDKSKLLVIYNGIDVEPFVAAASRRAVVRAKMDIASDTIAIGCLSNLIAYKGHSDLLAGFSGLVRTWPIFRPPLVLLLSGEDRGIGDKLRAEVSRHGLAEYVRFLGPCTDVPAFLSAIDVGVLPSHEEGFSNALLEMLSAGLPVVATEVGGNREALAEMEDCVLVPPFDSAALAAGLKTIIEVLPESAETRWTRIERMRKRFPVDAMVESYARLYRRFL